MRLYLVQHGEAALKSVDPTRSLTDRGRGAVDRMGRFVARQGATVDRIFHSGKTRARQTAEILARHLQPLHGSEEVEGLKPLDDPAIVVESLVASSEDTMLVGHLPHLAKLAGLLLTGTAKWEPVRFHNGGVVCLVQDESAGWAVHWIVLPNLLSD